MIFAFFDWGWVYGMGWDGMGWERMEEDGRGWKRMREEGEEGEDGEDGEDGEGVGEDGWDLPAVFEEVALGA